MCKSKLSKHNRSKLKTFKADPVFHSTSFPDKRVAFVWDLSTAGLACQNIESRAWFCLLPLRFQFYIRIYSEDVIQGLTAKFETYMVLIENSFPNLQVFFFWREIPLLTFHAITWGWIINGMYSFCCRGL